MRANEDVVDTRRGEGLGWLSVGLGLAEVAAPHVMARAIGTPSSGRILPALGLRELAVGLGLLRRPRSASWLWARVVGDVIDLGLLGLAWRRDRGVRPLAAAVVVAGITAVDAVTAHHMKHAASSRAAWRTVHCSVTIRRSASDVYGFWRDLTNLPRFMSQLTRVEVRDARLSHWVVGALPGLQIEWDAEIVLDQVGQSIAWRSLDDADVSSSGIVRFVPAPRDRGTEVHVELRYEPKGGSLVTDFMSLLGIAPARRLAADLRRLKQILETGETVRSDASIHRGLHPARQDEGGFAS